MQLAFRNSAYFSSDVLFNSFFSFQMKNFKIDQTTKKIKKKKAEMKKQLEESIISNENVDTEQSARKVQNSEEAAEVVEGMVKLGSSVWHQQANNGF